MFGHSYLKSYIFMTSSIMDEMFNLWQGTKLIFNEIDVVLIWDWDDRSVFLCLSEHFCTKQVHLVVEVREILCVRVCAHARVLVFHVPVNGGPQRSTPWSNLLRSLTASFSSRHGVWLDALTWLGTFRVAKTHSTSFIIPLLLRLCNLIKLFITFQLTPFPRVSVTLLFAEDKCIMG